MLTSRRWRGAPKICFPHRSLAARPLARRVAAGVAAYVAQHNLQRVVVATVHEDVVAYLNPRWIFCTAVVTTCWWQKNKKGNVFEDTGDTRTGCLVLLHADRLAATDEPATTDVARLDELFAAPSINLQLQRSPYSLRLVQAAPLPHRGHQQELLELGAPVERAAHRFS